MFIKYYISKHDFFLSSQALGNVYYCALWMEFRSVETSTLRDATYPMVSSANRILERQRLLAVGMDKLWLHYKLVLPTLFLLHF